MGLIVDGFAGGGGASLGIEMALGRSPDIAVNHDAAAVSMHRANHPSTRHLCGDIWDVNPAAVCGGRPVELAWFSPDCRHHSKAKGRAPRSAKIRALAWVVVRWARAVRPAVICLENVEEFAGWGPLLSDGTPCPARRGLTFRVWLGKLKAAGYDVEMRELRACDYGAPTTRKRLFVIARCDGRPIVWPTATHGRGLAPYRTAAECIDWTIPVPSIFERRKPLAEPTLRRIARGIERFVLGPDPFVVHDYAPTLVQTGYGEREDQAPRSLDLNAPLGTVVAGGAKHALVAAFLAKHYGGHENSGASLRLPMSTITTRDHHALVTASERGAHREEVSAFLLKYYGTSTGAQLQLPMPTATTKARFALVATERAQFEIVDVGMRMLAPRELFRAQGFPDSYVIDRGADGEAFTQTTQIRLCGNSVSPPVAAAIVAANVGSEARKVA